MGQHWGHSSREPSHASELLHKVLEPREREGARKLSEPDNSDKSTIALKNAPAC